MGSLVSLGVPSQLQHVQLRERSPTCAHQSLRCSSVIAAAGTCTGRSRTLLNVVGMLLLLMWPNACVAPSPALSALTDVVIYTKPVPPFSIAPTDGPSGAGGSGTQPKGLTIDYLMDDKEGLLAKLGSSASPPVDLISMVKVEMKEDNHQILKQVGTDYCNATQHPGRLCLGAAAISITAEREENYGVGFLPSYYLSGVRLMVGEDPTTELLQFAEEVAMLLVSATVYWICMICVIAPLVWTSESYWCPPGKISIFHHYDAQMMDVKNPERWDGVIDDADNPYINGLEITEAQRFRAEIKSAFMWTFMLGFGLTPGMPCSTFGKLVRWVGMQLMSIMKGAGVAIMAAMQISLKKRSDIKEFEGPEGLRAHHHVCVVQDTQPARFLTSRRNRGDIAYQIEPATDIQTMFQMFWNSECDAVVYDEPVLEYEMSNHNIQTLCEADLTDCTRRGIIVGEKMTFDPYGIAIQTDHPLYEDLKVATIQVLTDDDSDFMITLLEKWFHQDYELSLPAMGAPNIEKSSDFLRFFRSSFILSCLVISFIFALITVSYWYVRGWKTRTQRVAVDETSQDTQDYNFLMYRLLQTGKADIYTRDDSDLIHETTARVREVQKLLLDLLMMQESAPDRINTVGLRQKYGNMKNLDVHAWQKLEEADGKRVMVQRPGLHYVGKSLQRDEDQPEGSVQCPDSSFASDRYSTDADLNERKKFHVDPSIVGSVGDQSSVQIKQKRPRGRSHGLLETDLCDPHQERRSQPRLEPAPAPGPEPEPEPEPELMARSQMNPLGGAADAADGVNL